MHALNLYSQDQTDQFFQTKLIEKFNEDRQKDLTVKIEKLETKMKILEIQMEKATFNFPELYLYQKITAQVYDHFSVIDDLFIEPEESCRVNEDQVLGEIEDRVRKAWMLVDQLEL
jgi:acetyl-CoA carboxylase alpha subunit